ncbi:nitric-oxide reductase large subunit [Candidatus Methanoperedens nitratireducens]|uniref:Nitric oxide reductase large subunit n=1 Tax=Candidatus Methanoperedens nitratireducens TaxID=1392998 RepID=A0A284VRY2_9EURY|nr:cbb3-type cytochrome c oxidase subunit I [Candidatus Methanoperedens nitroreducens]SNQ62040.1 Nitric oxide reductase large subunit [Candidatus Methanoperedens nitroreducens]
MVSRIYKIVLFLAFAVSIIFLLVGGYYTSSETVPYPGKVVSGDKTLTDGAAIKRGEAVWQKYGLMDLGSIWGHGTVRGPDFSAQSLHMMGQEMRNYYAAELYKMPYAQLDQGSRAAIDTRVISEIKENRYDGGGDVLTLAPAQAYAYQKIKEYYQNVFSGGSKQENILPDTVKSSDERNDLADFFFWTGWAAGTNRPGLDYTYTTNWPRDPSVGNDLPAESVLWTYVSLLAMLVALGVVVYIIHAYGFWGGGKQNPDVAVAIANAPITSSQRMTGMFFLVAIALFLVQTLVGGLMSHYTVNPLSFYGMDFIANLLPYNLVKSWHLQLAVFWIAVSWIGASLYLSPLLTGKEPKHQGLLVSVLFIAILIVAAGSLLGEAAGIKGLLNGDLWYWFGHQGWEFLELGRLWQILLFLGLVIWLFIVYRVVKGIFQKGKERGDLPHMYFYSAIAIVGFYAFTFLVRRDIHITMADYWRWWMVHIWVESIFEFFAVAIIALITVSLGLAGKEGALKVVYLSATLAFISGILGTGHHLFWFGDPAFWVGVGGVFSTLEPIPLITLVARAWREQNHLEKVGVKFPYKWPMRFIIASSLWNFLGAGAFGFILTTPVANYYEHGTYLTTNHGHTALFGVYGMLAIALILIAYRGIVKPEFWDDRPIKLSFIALNAGFLIMSFGTLFLAGLVQLGYTTSAAGGVWYARSPEFFNSPAFQLLGSFRIIPDTLIIVFGVLPLLYFMVTTIMRRKEATIKEEEPIFKTS